MISRISSDAILYEKMSRAALERYAIELNSVQMTENTEAFYKELCQERVKAFNSETE